MKKRIILIISLFIFGICFSQTDTTFTSLRGFQDSSGNTFLYYIEKFSKHSIDEVSANLFVDSTIFIHNIYNVETKTNYQITKGSETIYYPENHLQQSRIADIEFIDNDPNKYIYAVNLLGIDPDSRFIRYDVGETMGLLGFIEDIFISNKNSNNIYAVAYNWVLQSFDGGLTWPDDSSFIFGDKSIQYLTFSPFDELIIFGINGSNQLVISNNKGKSFTQVSNIGDWQGDIELFFDRDQKHIYATINSSVSNNVGLFYVSENNGLIDSWELVKITSNNILVCIDDSTSGSIFLSTGNDILESTDYGQNFTKIVELQHHANGLHKEPFGDLYASIPNKILEISEDSISSILSKSTNNNLAYFPIDIGNKWYYNESGTAYEVEPIIINNTYTEEITKDSIDNNGQKYFYLQSDFGNYWLRIDSTTGNIYKKYSFEDLEFLAYNLVYQPDDKIETENGIIYNVIEQDSILWEDLRNIKTHQLYSLYTHQITFAEDIGIINKLNSFDFGNTEVKLLGCLIDGKMYGDTTVVGIQDNRNEIPTQFSLLQNYPNPFNPTTTIEYTIPNVGATHESPLQLQVYDVLGKEVTTLVNKSQFPGKHQIVFDASNLSSGIYYYSLRINNHIISKKMIFLK